MRFWGAPDRASPVDRARTGSKHHLITDAAGIPLAISLTGGNRNDVTQLLPLIDAVGPVRGQARPSAQARNDGCSPTAAMTTTSTAASCGKRGVKPVIARRGTEHGSGLGRERWVVERTFAWLHNLRRLQNPLRALGGAAPGVHAARLRRGLPTHAEQRRLLLVEPHPWSSRLRRPYWSGIEPHPQIATGIGGIDAVLLERIGLLGLDRAAVAPVVAEIEDVARTPRQA